MKKLLIALTFALILMVAFAAPVLADKGGEPNKGASASSLGALRHGQAPGQGGLAPGRLGEVISGANAGTGPYASLGGVPGVMAEIVLFPWANPQGANAGPK